MRINNLMPMTDMVFGLQGLVWADKFLEAWGLDYVDEGSMEKLGYLHDADFGVSFYVVPTCGWGEVILQAVNGGGLTESEHNKNKDLVAFLQINPLKDQPGWSHSAIWAQYYKGWPNIEPSGNLSFSDNTAQDRLSVAGLIKYSNWFTAYADYFLTTDDMNDTDVPDTTVTGVNLPDEEKANGVTVFAKVAVATAEDSWLSDVYLFAKYEYLDKHTDHEAEGLQLYADEDDARFITIGAGYELTEGFHFALTLKRSTVNRLEFDAENLPLRVAETERNTIFVNMLAAF
jgi:hypothetical protein